MNYNVSGVATWRQFDTRWGSLGYRWAPHTMATDGCGPTACANIISAKRGITPKETRDWFINHGYCANGNGSYRAGIAACLSAYGFSVIQHGTMQAFLTEMAKGDRMGVICFRGGTRGGVTWTLGGHFMAVSGYKEVGGKHWLYMHDSGARKHDGWYCYEDHMCGLCDAVWSCRASGVQGGATSGGSAASSSASAATGQAVSEPVRYVTAANGLNVRTGPGTGYPVLYTLKKGTPIKVVRRSGNWGYSNGAGGWVCTDYLSGGSSSGSSGGGGGYSAGLYHVNTAALNVRAGAGTGYRKVGMLGRGTPLQILKVSGSWGYSKGAGGWVHLGYCRKG